MPEFDFALSIPAWAIWLTLFLCPLAAALIGWIRRPRGRLSLTRTYAVWALGGFVGFHRFLLRNIWGILYLPFVGLALYAWTMEHRASTTFAEIRQSLEQVDGVLTRNDARSLSASAGIEAARAALADLGASDDERAKELELIIERESARAAEAQAEIVATNAELPILKAKLAQAAAALGFWSDVLFKVIATILAFLALDGILLPSLRRHAAIQPKAPLAP